MPVLVALAVLGALFDPAGIPVLLVGDSAANNVYGHETTLPVTVDELGWRVLPADGRLYCTHAPTQAPLLEAEGFEVVGTRRRYYASGADAYTMRRRAGGDPR